jgi:hypothetical protein
MIASEEGMTKIYNRFHDPTETADDIQRLRELHGDMDRAVLEAYSWHDLAARAEAVFIDETTEDDHTYQGRLFWPSDFRNEVLARLLALNAERHAEEVRLGVGPGMSGRALEPDDYESDDESDTARGACTVKPEVTKDFAARVGHRFDSDYEFRLEFGFYESVLDLASRSTAELVELKPRYSIDVQGSSGSSATTRGIEQPLP